MTRKTLVILAVLAVALIAVAVSTDAMRGGMRGGSGGMGGSGGGAAPVPGGNYDNGGNIGNTEPLLGYDCESNTGVVPDNLELYLALCGSNTGNVGNYELPPGNYDTIDVYVSTDKSTYTKDESIEITVTAHNPADHPIGVDWSGCTPIGYTIDGYITQYTTLDENGNIAGGGGCAGGGTYVFQPYGTLTGTFTRNFLPVGIHSVVGTVGTGDSQYESDPTTIWVTELDAGHMGGGNYEPVPDGMPTRGMHMMQLSYSYWLPYVWGNGQYGCSSSQIWAGVRGHALEDGVTVEMDLDNDGVADAQWNLSQKGEEFTYYPMLDEHAGAHITSDGPLYITYTNNRNNCGMYDDNSLTYTVLPESFAKGADFYVPTYGSAYILPVAGTTEIYKNGVLIATKDRGSSHAVSVSGGDHITASDDIVITMRYWYGDTRSWAYYLIPTKSYGTDYYLIKHFRWPTVADGTDYSLFNVVAKQDNTHVKVDTDNDGLPDQTFVLSAGQVKTLPTIDGTHVYADAPILVAYISESYDNEPWGRGWQYNSYAYVIMPTNYLQKEFVNAYPSRDIDTKHCSGSKVFIGAVEDDTQIQIDDDKDGVPDRTLTLNAGEVSDVSIGHAFISADKPIQGVSVRGGGWYCASGVDSTYEGSSLLGLHGGVKGRHMGDNYEPVPTTTTTSTTTTTTIDECIPDPYGVCTAQYDPVCGVDGNTYSNECVAGLLCVDIAYSGACVTTTTPPPGNY